MKTESLRSKEWPWVSPISSVEHLEKRSWPKISIVTPSYNQGQYIEETILSVINQGYPNLEYIIIDGGSTDNTVEIIKKYEKHITYWVSEPDRGQSHAINKGLERCTGDVFNWLNSDDYYEPEVLREVGRVFQDERWLVVTGGRKFIDSEGKVKSTSNNTLRNTLEETIGQLQFGQPSTFFKREAFEKMGSLREDMDYMMDVAWWLTFLFTFGQDRVKRLGKRNLVNFRLHDCSKTISKEVGFLEDQKNIELSLLEQLGISYDLLYSLAKSYGGQLLNNHWNIEVNLDKKLLASLLLSRISHNLYGWGNYREASMCVECIRETTPELFKVDNTLSGLSNRLLIPSVLLRKARNAKQVLTNFISY